MLGIYLFYPYLKTIISSKYKIIQLELIEDILFSLELIEKNLRNYQSGIYLKEKQPFINNIIDYTYKSLTYYKHHLTSFTVFV